MIIKLTFGMTFPSICPLYSWNDIIHICMTFFYDFILFVWNVTLTQEYRKKKFKRGSFWLNLPTHKYTQKLLYHIFSIFIHVECSYIFSYFTHRYVCFNFNMYNSIPYSIHHVLCWYIIIIHVCTCVCVWLKITGCFCFIDI